MTWWDVWVSYAPQLLDGLRVSLALTGITLLTGIPLGLLLALGNSARVTAVRWLTLVVVEVGRGAPALVVLYLVYYGLPSAHLTLSAFASACVGLTWTTGAYTSEYIRGGLKAVPRGTVEAATALAMSRRDTLVHVILPQGMRIAIPSLMGFAIQLFQMTSLTYSITVRELTSMAYSIGTQTFQFLAVFALAGLLYAVITIPATWLTNLLEHRMSVRQ